MRRHRGRLFMAKIDRPDAEILRVVDDLVVRTAHQVEETVRALLLESAGDQVTTVNLGHVLGKNPDSSSTNVKAQLHSIRNERTLDGSTRRAGLPTLGVPMR